MKFGSFVAAAGVVLMLAQGQGRAADIKVLSVLPLKTFSGRDRTAIRACDRPQTHGRLPWFQSIEARL